MHADAIPVPIISPAEFVSAVGAGPLVVGAAVLLAAVVLLLISWITHRSRLRRDVRSILQALEELRTGRGRGHTKIGARSSINLVADAVHRLGVDLHGTWSEAETAAERWRALTDATRDTAIITTDTDGDVRSFSAGAAKLTGWEESEIVSRPAAVLFDESAYKDLLPKLARRSIRSQGVTTRSTLVRRGGSTFQAEVAVRMLVGSNAQPVGFMMLVRDITEQIGLENELRESEHRYRSLVEGLSEGLVLVREGRIVYLNPAAEAICGFEGSELLGTPWRDRVATGDVLVMEDALEAAAAGEGSAEEVGCTLLGPEREARAEARIKVARVESGDGVAVMLLVRDETEARRAEAELRRNEMRLDAVLEATSDGVLVLSNDPASTVRMTNRAFGEMFGLAASELLGVSEDRLARKLHEAAPDGAALAERITGGAPDEASTPVTIGGERPREIRVTVAALTGRGGEALGRVVACRDVTERRRSERELQDQAERLQLSKIELERSYAQLDEINRKLEARGEELGGLNQELRRLDEMKSDLIGNVSHELQTPLVSIRGYTEMILKERLGPISEEQRKGLSLSLKNIDRLISMIDNLLAFSRSNPHLRELKLTRFGLRPLVGEAVALLDEKIRERGLQVAVRIQGDEVVVQADRDKVLQVLLNLLTNAVKFSHDGGRIEVAARGGQPGYATVSVQDQGVGIPPEALDRIFERHYRVEGSSSGEAEGSGIGLSIVRDILRLHGCTVHAASEEGRGARFTFTLPLAGEGRGSGKAEVEVEAEGAAEPEPPVEPEVVAPEADPVVEPVIVDGPAIPAEAEAGEETPDESRESDHGSRPRLRIIRRYESES